MAERAKPPEPDEPGSPSPEDSPRIRLLPPLVYLSLFGLGWALDRLRPWPIAQSFTALEALRWTGGALVAAGVLLDLWSIGLFNRAGTSALPFRPASALVAQGPYRWTRNPMYLGLTLALLGVGLFLGRVWIALAAFVAALVIDRTAIAKEERYLERKFGVGYLDYRRRVRRWL